MASRPGQKRQKITSGHLLGAVCSPCLVSPDAHISARGGPFYLCCRLVESEHAQTEVPQLRLVEITAGVTLGPQALPPAECMLQGSLGLALLTVSFLFPPQHHCHRHPDRLKNSFPPPGLQRFQVITENVSGTGNLPQVTAVTPEGSTGLERDRAGVHSFLVV